MVLAWEWVFCFDEQFLHVKFYFQGNLYEVREFIVIDIGIWDLTGFMSDVNLLHLPYVFPYFPFQLPDLPAPPSFLWAAVPGPGFLTDLNYKFIS